MKKIESKWLIKNQTTEKTEKTKLNNLEMATVAIDSFDTDKKSFLSGAKMHGDFEELIAPLIPEMLSYLGEKIETFKVAISLNDTNVSEELGGFPVMPIARWAAKTAAYINKFGIKNTTVDSLVSYVEMNDGSIMVIHTRDKWFKLYELNDYDKGSVNLGSLIM